MGRLPFGAGPALLIILAVASSGWLMAHPVHGPGNDPAMTCLRVWTFAQNHYKAYLEAIPAFEASHPGVCVTVEMVHYRAVNERLRAAFWADLNVPDLVEVEIAAAGGFFRGSLEDIGFVDLTDRIEAAGLDERVV